MRFPGKLQPYLALITSAGMVLYFSPILLGGVGLAPTVEVSKWLQWGGAGMAVAGSIMYIFRKVNGGQA